MKDIISAQEQTLCIRFIKSDNYVAQKATVRAADTSRTYRTGAETHRAFFVSAVAVKGAVKHSSDKNRGCDWEMQISESP